MAPSFGRPAFGQEEQEGGQAEALTGSWQEEQALHVHVSLESGLYASSATIALLLTDNGCRLSASFRSASMTRP